MHCAGGNNSTDLLQIRFLMKSYSFMRETVPVLMKNTPKEGTVLCSIDVKCVYS